MTDSAISAGQNDDGTCLATLGKQCQTDLVNAVDPANALETGFAAGICNGFISTIPQSCKSKFIGTSVGFQMPAEDLKTGPQPDPFLLVTSSSDGLGSNNPTGHQTSNLTIYDAARKQVTLMIFTTIQPDNTSNVTSGDFQSSTGIVCLRANSVVPGSRSAADRVGSGFGMLSSVVMVLMLMLLV